jgi:hypothetical protein
MVDDTSMDDEKGLVVMGPYAKQKRRQNFKKKHIAHSRIIL